MTLIAGFKCTDGFTIAADTEITMATVSVQGHKLIRSGLGDAHTFCIGFAGDVAHGLAASQNVRNAILGLEEATVENVKAAVREELDDFYQRHIFLEWGLIGEVPPSFELIIGIQGHEQKEFTVLHTTHNVVHEVQHSIFIGSGSDLAAHVSEKLFSGNPLSAAITHHLAQQLFREIKGKVPRVGGNTEIFSRRAVTDANPFFEIASLHDENRAVWGLEDLLLSAVRIAMSQQFQAFPGKAIPDLLEKRIEQIRRRVEAIHTDSHATDGLSRLTSERYTLEFDTEIGNPFQDY